MATADAAADDRLRRGALLAWAGSGVQRGTGVWGPAPGRPDGRGGAVGDMGAGDRAGTGRATLGTLNGGTIGRE